MWTFFEDGTFYSAVTDFKDTDVMWVRSRDRRSADLYADFVGGDVIELARRDYAYRVKSSRTDWANFVSNQIQTARATNFKSEVGRNVGHSSPFVDALHKVWGVMFRFQNQMESADHSKKYEYPDEEYTYPDVADVWDENPGLAAKYGLPPF